jgi:hypothetical protein
MTPPGPFSLVPEGEPIRCILHPSARARRMTIKVGTEGVVVVYPIGTPLSDVEAFLREQASWTVQTLQKLRAQGALDATLDLTRRVAFHGQEFPVVHVPARPEARPRVGLAEGQLEVHSPSPASVGSLVHLYLQRIAAREIEAAVRRRQAEMGVPVLRVTVRAQRSRWGSCTGEGALSLNWRLVMAPPEVLDYVVVHELSHRRHPDHSPAFWAEVETWCPDWRKLRGWLRQNERRLMAFKVRPPPG